MDSVGGSETLQPFGRESNMNRVSQILERKDHLMSEPPRPAVDHHADLADLVDAHASCRVLVKDLVHHLQRRKQTIFFKTITNASETLEWARF